MTNRSKAKGTKFETQVCLWLRERLEDDRIERRALHGSRDMGDLYGLWAHGWEGIVECKDYDSWADADLAKWQRQAEDERLNACADWALLVVHRKGCGAARVGSNHTYLTIRSLLYLAGIRPQERPHDCVLDAYVELTLAKACDLMTFEEED